MLADLARLFGVTSTDVLGAFVCAKAMEAAKDGRKRSFSGFRGSIPGVVYSL